LHEIQDRTGEPIALRVDGLTEEEIVAKLAGLLALLKQRLPPEFLPVVSEVAYEFLAGEERPWLLVEHEDEDPT